MIYPKDLPGGKNEREPEHSSLMKPKQMMSDIEIIHDRLLSFRTK